MTLQVKLSQTVLCSFQDFHYRPHSTISIRKPWCKNNFITLQAVNGKDPVFCRSPVNLFSKLNCLLGFFGFRKGSLLTKTFSPSIFDLLKHTKTFSKKLNMQYLKVYSVFITSVFMSNILVFHNKKFVWGLHVLQILFLETEITQGWYIFIKQDTSSRKYGLENFNRFCKLSPAMDVHWCKLW